MITLRVVVEPERFNAYFPYAFGGTEVQRRDMLQLVWPDNDLRYPWDDDAAAHTRQLQPLLGAAPRQR